MPENSQRKNAKNLLLVFRIAMAYSRSGRIDQTWNVTRGTWDLQGKGTARKGDGTLILVFFIEQQEVYKF